MYFDRDANDQPLKMSSTGLFAAVEAAAAGKLKVKHSENLIERFARVCRFDLLSVCLLTHKRQSLSAKFSWIEYYILQNPLHSFLFIVVVLIVLFIVIQRWVSADGLDAEYGALRKGDRID